MSIRTTAVLSAAALALAACGHKTETTTTNDTTVATANDMANDTAATTPAPSGAQAFANAAAASDTFEIETSKVALAGSRSAAVKKFANTMVDAHTKSTAKLKTAAGEASITPDPALTAEQAATLADLKAKSGGDLDAAYIAAQKDGHAKTLAKLKDYAASGDAAPLKTFAGEMVPTVTGHLNMANGLKP